MTARYLAAAVLAVIFARPAVAQDPGPCDLTIDRYGTLNAVKLPTGTYQSFIGGGVTAHCAGQDNQLVADSAEHYEERGVLYLIGNVHYTEPRAKVDSDRMTYFQGEERLHAEGSVLVTFAAGTVMRGPEADYYRVIPGVRPLERLVARGRPQMTLVQTDSAGRPAAPVIVLADRITMDGDSLVYAGGSVDITRTDVNARSDSAFLDGRSEFMRLMRRPEIVGRGQRAFTLRGGTIDLFSRARKLDRVVSTPKAHALTEGIELLADSIDLRIVADALDRAQAWGPSRARATSPERDIIADSIDVRLAAQKLREVVAVGGAHATSIPDTARIISNERDWMTGDTIVARFDTSATTAERATAREIVATGSARSFYQIPPEGGSRTDPTLNYVRGSRITVELREGAIERVTVSRDAVGAYLERPPGR